MVEGARSWEHDDAAEQTAINTLGNMARMVMEWPRALHLVGVMVKW